MTFFNKKTDVIDIELTPYGRYLLSIGKLKPVFYEFLDDDILYDKTAVLREYGGTPTSEEQNLAHERITKNTPKLKTLYLRKGVESNPSENYRPAATETGPGLDDVINVNIDNIREQEEFLTYDQKGVYAMGKSSYSSEKFPNFQITMLKGEIAGTTDHLKILSGQSGSLQIPQINVDFFVTATTGSQLETLNSDSEFTSRVFSDGTFVKLSFEEPMFHLKEFNSFYEKENFEIEVFKVIHPTPLGQGDSISKLEPLKFMKEEQAIVNDLLVDPKEFSVRPDSDALGPDFVEYYFELDMDDQIPIEEICKNVDKLEINNQFLDEEIICPDQRTERFDIYSTRVDPTDLEDCD